MRKVTDYKAPIPKLEKGIAINHGDKNKVLYTIFPHYDPELGYTSSSRVVIGHAINDEEMVPNENYKKYFPELWKSISNEDVPPPTKRIGLHALMEGACRKNNLIDILQKVFGISKACSILDFAMYSVGYHTNAAMNYPQAMREHSLFSSQLHDDSYYSNLFTHEMPERMINLFRIKWIQECVRQGITEAYLAIDGSNDDCESKGIELAEKGAAKSHTNSDIIGFMYAVHPQTGKVVTFDTYRGGLVDSKAILKIITFLKENGVSVKGIIIDRGFCDGNCLSFLRSKQIPYVLMMKGNTAGHNYMLAMHGDELRWNSDCWIPDTLVFATSEVNRLFDRSSLSAHLHLYYDFKNGDERCEALLNKISKLIKKIENATEEPSVPKELKEIITVIPNENGSFGYKIQNSSFQSKLNSKGYFTIAASENISSKAVLEMYRSRDAAETEYMFIKTQLGYDAVRVQSESCMRSRFLVGTVAAIVREEVENACKELNLKTNTMIHEMRQLSAASYNTKTYTVVHTEKGDVKDLMSKIGIQASDLDNIAISETQRLSGEIPVLRKKKPGPKKGSHRQKYDESGKPVKVKPGPKPGSHHKVKYNKDGSIRKKPGPKPGSHHKQKSDDSSGS